MLLFYKQKKVTFNNVLNNHKPYLWIYWQGYMPAYIRLCIKSAYQHCSKSFNIKLLNDKSVYKFIPEKQHLHTKLEKLLIAQKVDYYRIYLLYKYGGLYIDADTLILRDPIEIIEKLKTYDYVGFGCTGQVCNYGYGRPSNGIMASRAKGVLIEKILRNIETVLISNIAPDNYFTLGKYIIWHELEELIKKHRYVYYHYSNDYDGTRDRDGKWVTAQRLFSNKNIDYAKPNELMFIVLYNSNMSEYKKLTEEEILLSDSVISYYFKKSLMKN